MAPRTATLFAACLITLVSCSKGQQKDNKDAFYDIPPAELPSNIEGTPFQAVDDTQRKLAELFDPLSEVDSVPENVLAVVRTFEEANITQFKADCAAMLQFYSKDPAHNLTRWAEYGRRWHQNRNNIKSLTQEWTPGHQGLVDIVIDVFTCR